MSQSSSGGSGLGCLTFPLGVLLFAAVFGLWAYADGADPREAIAHGLTYGTCLMGGVCGLISLIFVGVIGLALWQKR